MNNEQALEQIFDRLAQLERRYERRQDRNAQQYEDESENSHSDNDPEEEAEEEEKLVSAIEAREAGAYDLQESVKHLFPEDSTLSLLSSRSAKRLFHKYPTPRGGYLQSPRLESFRQHRIPKQTLLLDVYLAEIQKDILGLARPLLLFLNKMDADQGKIDPKDLAVTLEDTIYLTLHTAAKVKVERRSRIAKEAKLPQGMARDAKFVRSSSKDSLFGEGFISEVMEQERAAILFDQTHKPKPQSRPNYQGRRQYNNGRQGKGVWGQRSPRNQRYDNNSNANYNNAPSNPTNTSSSQLNRFPGN
ncbi:uncharacterized protein VTP21DRAFT_3518 [Calcarisporiella thermophila]|uniref:uncharacterized protein n=1 Tax=Calcarisporiella thermophila TaxID=911321 RepID=UPI0037448BC7